MAKLNTLMNIEIKPTFNTIGIEEITFDHIAFIGTEKDEQDIKCAMVYNKEYEPIYMHIFAEDDAIQYELVALAKQLEITNMTELDKKKGTKIKVVGYNNTTEQGKTYFNVSFNPRKAKQIDFK